MLKIFVALVLAICVYEAQGQDTCGPVCKNNSLAICAADHQISNCQRMTQCELDRENCRRRAANLATISNVAESRCINLPLPNGSGPCAPVPRQRRGTKGHCNHLRCHSKSQKLRCVRCKKDNTCQLLTDCQLQRENCKRGSRNHMSTTDSRRCAGMKGGQSLKKCKSLPKKH